jgi:uncharacterized protein (TIGR02594 family)
MNSVGRVCINRRADVEVIQTLLNKHLSALTPMRPLRVDGIVGDQTIAAIEQFQTRVMGMARPDGQVAAFGPTLKALGNPYDKKLRTRMLSSMQPTWIKVATSETDTAASDSWFSVAQSQIGQKEQRGYDNNNPRILEYLRTFKYLATANVDKSTPIHCSDVDETAWCAAFVNWCLLQAGRSPGPSARARDWLQYGTALDVPVPGAITIIYKKPKVRADRQMTPSGNHVGFYVRSDGTSVTLLGGNQSNQVRESTFKGYTIKGYRWPS